MSTYKKVVSIVFSVVVLLLGLFLMLTMGGILSPSFGANFIAFIAGRNVLSKIFFVIGLAIMLIALRELIFGEKINSDDKDGLILENETGKLIISKESLENLIAGVGKEIPGVESISSRTFIDVDKNVTVDVNVVIPREISIKEISSELQKKVREALKQTADLDVKYVNINIKNISGKKNKKPVQETSNDSSNETTKNATNDKDEKSDKENNKE